MARLARVVAPGIPHHITQRGNRRQAGLKIRVTPRFFLGDAVSVVAQKVPISPLPNVAAQTKANFLVNLWGSKDILAETGIGGYRSELVGFTPDGVRGTDGQITKQLYNIEILGATHFDYMRETNGSTWNVTVSDFVTRLMIASKSKENLQQFLSRQPAGVVTQDSSGKYIVNLPGHP